MFGKRLLLVVLAALSTVSVSLAEDGPEQVTIHSSLRRLSRTQAELTIRAEIADGLHIYAQTQPKPFLATKLTVESSPEIAWVESFEPSSMPLRLRHDNLGVDLHEHEGTVEWRAIVNLTETNTDNLVVRGTVYAQACQANRCFAPQTYVFEARDGDTIARTASDAGSLTPVTFVANDSAKAGMEADGEAASTAGVAAFSIDNLEVQSTDSQSAWTVLPLAFVAGFMLNFMPCVLPVVGLKLLSFVQQANSDRKRILLMNLAYTAGLLSVMWILATLASFAGLGWGEQFSSTAFTVTLSAIVFAFGLSFLGVWEIPLPGFVGEADGKTKQEGYGGAFTKGILSTLLATPCSGPFLGAALAWAVTQPTYLTYAVFTSVGLGMASPYLVIGLFPSAIRFLPKPGNWMVTFKQIMGFIMLATVVYLMSFMPVAAVVPTALLLLGVGFAIWQAGKTPIYASAPELVKAWALATLLIAVTAVGSFGWLEGVMQSRFERAAERWIASTGQNLTGSIAKDEDGIQWEAYSESRLEELIESGRPVFVDFTADWCLTCKANEATAICTPEFAAALGSGQVVALRADKTESNPEADALLRSLGNSAASIPFYAFFPADQPTKPILLDGVFASPEPFVTAATRSAGRSGNQPALTVVGMVSRSGTP